MPGLFVSADRGAALSTRQLWESAIPGRILVADFRISLPEYAFWSKRT